MNVCSTLLVLYSRNCPKDDKYGYLIPHFEEVTGGAQPWFMGRWNARVRLPIRHNYGRPM